MKKIFFIILIVNFTSKAQQVEWAKPYPSAGFTAPNHILPAYSNGVIIAGELLNYPLYGAFVCAIDSLGNKLWDDSLIGIYPSQVGHQRGLSCARNGNIYYGGMFNGMVYSGTDTLKSQGTGISNIFLAKYDSTGQRQWLKSFAKSWDSWLCDIATDANNNLYILLTFQDSISLFGQNFVTKGKSDLLLVKINSNDQLTWAKQFSGTVQGYKLKTLANNDLLIFGSYVDTLYFDSSNFSGPNANGSYAWPFFIDISSSGSVIKYKSDQVNEIYPSGVEVIHNKMIITGRSCWTSGCGTYFQLWDTIGNFIWNKAIPYVAQYGDVHLLDHITATDSTGFWAFGHDWTVNDYGDPNDDRNKLSLLKFDLNGNILVNDSFPTSTDRTIGLNAGITHDGFNNLYITAIFADTLTLGNYTLIDPHQTLFVAKLKVAQATGVIPLVTDQGSAVHVFPNPTSEKFIISKVNTFIPGQIKIYNSFGEKINYKINKNEVDLSSQPKGIYFVEISTDGKRTVKKIILE